MCSSDCPRSHSVDHAGLKLTGIGLLLPPEFKVMCYHHPAHLSIFFIKKKKSTYKTIDSRVKPFVCLVAVLEPEKQITEFPTTEAQPRSRPQLQLLTSSQLRHPKESVSTPYLLIQQIIAECLFLKARTFSFAEKQHINTTLYFLVAEFVKIIS